MSTSPKVEDHPFCWDTYSIPWDKLTIEQAKIDIPWAIKRAERRVKGIKKVTKPTWNNTFLAYMYMHYELGLAMGRLGLLYKINNTKEMQEFVAGIIPAVSAFNAYVNTDTELYNIMKNAAEVLKDTVGDEEKNIMEKYLKDAILTGVHLSDQDKVLFEHYNSMLSRFSLTFSNNVFNSKNELKLIVDGKENLDGLHDDIIQDARKAAILEGLGDDKYVLTLSDNVAYDVMAYANNEHIRKQYHRLQNSIGRDKYDTAYFIEQILKYREKLAKLLGFDTYADQKMFNRMIGSKKKAITFIEHFADALDARVKQDLDTIRQGKQYVESHNLPYEMRKLRDAKFKYDIEESRKYFRIEGVMKTLMFIAEHVFGVKFMKNYVIPSYHEDVEVYTAVDSNTMKTLGTAYIDIYERENKGSGAFVSLLRPGVTGDYPSWISRIYKGHSTHNTVALVCNFKKSNGDKGPDHTEIETLFHEFGHLIHMLLSNTKYPSMHSHCVVWDFIEFPSTLMENFTWLPCIISDINENSQEYGAEVIPQEIVDNMCAARKYLRGWTELRQVLFSQYDMYVHTHSVDEINGNPAEPMKRFTEKYNAPNELESVVAIPYKFQHIFAGGYAAGYYSYKWSEMLASNAFMKFYDSAVNADKTKLEKNSFLRSAWREAGHNIAQNIFKKGASVPADELLKSAGIEIDLNYMKRDYDIT